MRVVRTALIGGTGISERLAALEGTPIHVRTEFGLLRARTVWFDGHEVLAVERHSGGHRVPPHRVNYRAIAKGLAQLGVERCFSTAAVGSLRADWGPGTLVVCSDLIDVSARRQTLFDRTVKHTDLTEPFPAADWLRRGLKASGSAVVEGTYINVDGPRYETPAEIEAFRGMGGHVVGMTAGSEAIAMAEAGVRYGCLAIVTNLAAGMSPTTLAHGGVVEVMRGAGGAAMRVLEAAVRAG